MTWINVITEDPSQGMTLVLPDGTSVKFSMKYFDGQQGWYYSLTYGNFQLSNRRIVVGLNLLRAFRNIIPFGFKVTTQNGGEILGQEDFINNNASFYLLDSEDIVEAEALLA
jgi:hypothetical protein